MTKTGIWFCWFVLAVLLLDWAFVISLLHGSYALIIGANLVFSVFAAAAVCAAFRLSADDCSECPKQ